MRLTVGKKLSFGFTMILLLMVAIGGISISKLSGINGKVQEINTSWLPGVDAINNVNFLTEHVLALTLSHEMGIGSKGDIEKQRGDAINELAKTFNDYEKTIFLPDDRKNFDELKGKWQTYLDANNKIIELSKANDKQGAEAALAASKAQFDAMQTNLDALVKLNADGSKQAAADSSALFTSSIWTVSIIIIFSFIIGIAAMIFFVGIISKPLIVVTETIGKVANGDLTVKPVLIKSKDEIGDLGQSCNTMVKNLREVMEDALNTSQSVAAASQQISASTEEIASGSTSQANDAATMSELFKELSAAITSVASSASEAAELSNQTTDIAKDGGEVVRSSIEGMNLVNTQMSRLQEDSNKIGEIIEVIDEIAEQTNLLALNAAIEAARAGEQGRGFAVVADEVRKLAERSGEATKQITTIIKGMQNNTRNSVKAVEEGVTFTQQTGEAFEHIIKMVNDSAQKVTEIAAASQQQSAQSSEVLVSIESISASTEEAAASSEETAATAQSLAKLAEELNHSVSVFKIN